MEGRSGGGDRVEVQWRSVGGQPRPWRTCPSPRQAAAPPAQTCFRKRFKSGAGGMCCVSLPAAGDPQASHMGSSQGTEGVLSGDPDSAQRTRPSTLTSGPPAKPLAACPRGSLRGLLWEAHPPAQRAAGLLHPVPSAGATSGQRSLGLWGKTQTGRAKHTNKLGENREN